jgi:hypothetical protein
VIQYSYRDLAGEAIHVDEQKPPTLSEQELRKLPARCGISNNHQVEDAVVVAVAVR